MNERQMADRIGNIDDRLVQQAERVPNYKKIRRMRNIKRLALCAATFALMVCSFRMGMVVQAKQSASQEEAVETQIVELEDFNLAVILPDSWKGLYGVEREADDCYTFYSTKTRDDWGDGTGGNLFYIVRWGEPLTEEQVKAGGEWDYVGNEYIMATKNETYLLYYVSDVEYTEATKESYHAMLAEISQVRFVTSGVIPEE